MIGPYEAVNLSENKLKSLKFLALVSIVFGECIQSPRVLSFFYASSPTGVSCGVSFFMGSIEKIVRFRTEKNTGELHQENNSDLYALTHGFYSEHQAPRLYNFFIASDSESRGPGFAPHKSHGVVSLSKTHWLPRVLLKTEPRKRWLPSYMTEQLLTGR